jgi:hypothetical protein
MRRLGSERFGPGGDHVHDGPDTGRRDDRLEEPGLLGDRLDEKGTLGRQGHGQRQARVATAGTEIEEPGDAVLAQPRDRRQAVEDVGPGDGRRLADRGEVDRGRPGEQEPDVVVDRGPCRAREVEAQRRQAGVENGPVLGRQLG